MSSTSSKEVASLSIHYNNNKSTDKNVTDMNKSDVHFSGDNGIHKTVTDFFEQNGNTIFLENCENFENFVKTTYNQTETVLVGNHHLKFVRMDSQEQNSCGYNISKYTLCFDGIGLENDFKNQVVRETVNYNSIEWFVDNENQTVGCLDLSKYSSNFSGGAQTESTQLIGPQAGENQDINFKAEIKLESDDDVVFIKEYKIPEEPVQETNIVPKRRNPRRKVQLEKASVDLANKLTIPLSVFNARIRKSTRKTNVQTKKCLRSNRITKETNALSPLDKAGLREWPDEGMHERPVYNEATNSIDKLDPFLKTKEINKKNNSTAKEKLKTATVTKVTKKYKNKRKFGKRNKKDKEEIDIDLSFIVHERLQLILGYISQLKIHRDLLKITDERKTSSEEFSNVYDILADASILYSIIANVDQVDLANYLKSVDKNEAVKFLQTYSVVPQTNEH